MRLIKKHRWKRVLNNVPRNTPRRNIIYFGVNKEYHATKGWRKGRSYGKQIHNAA